jgi:hypothetical protein
MQIIRPDDAVRRANSSVCVVADYPTRSKELALVSIDIDGRYPETGKVYNTTCTMIAYVLRSDGGRIFYRGEECLLEPGSEVRIDRDDRYYWDGHLKLLVASAPAWYPEQHRFEPEASPLPEWAASEGSQCGDEWVPFGTTSTERCILSLGHQEAACRGLSGKDCHTGNAARIGRGSGRSEQVSGAR